MKQSLSLFFLKYLKDFFFIALGISFQLLTSEVICEWMDLSSYANLWAQHSSSSSSLRVIQPFAKLFLLVLGHTLSNSTSRLFRVTLLSGLVRTPFLFSGLNSSSVLM